MILQIDIRNNERDRFVGSVAVGEKRLRNVKHEIYGTVIAEILKIVDLRSFQQVAISCGDPLPN